MSLKKAFVYDASHNKIRHTYVNPEIPDGISWVIKTEKYQTLFNLKIKGSLYLVIGDKKSTHKRGILIKYEEQFYKINGDILFLCVSDDLMSVKDAELEVKDISQHCKIIESHD